MKTQIEGERAALPIPSDRLEEQFGNILTRRRSVRAFTRGPGLSELSGLLWHACRVRDTGDDSGDTQWSSTAAPTAGGAVAYRIVVDLGDSPWIYDPIAHNEIKPGKLRSEALLAQRREAFSIVSGTPALLYVIADIEALEGRYENPESLAWRDSGAVTTLLQLCATALGLSACILGIHGAGIIEALSLSHRKWLACGVIAVGM